MPYPVTKRTAFDLESGRTALLVVDMQNDFVRVGAPLEVPDARATIPATQRLIAFARDQGMPVIYTRFLAGPEYTLLWEWSPVVGPETKCCWKGHYRYYEDIGREVDGSDVIDELYPQPGDGIVEKYGYNAFFGTNMLDMLRAHHRDMIIVAGTVTQICVEDTVRGAFHYGIRAVVASDAVSSFDDELHRVALRGIDMKYGRVLDVQGIMEEVAPAVAS